MDVSADLTELGRTSVAVISSGCKSFLDIPRTLEYLETQGVAVCTFADGRTGPIDFPAFYTRDSGSKSPMAVQDAKEAAAMICKLPQTIVNRPRSSILDAQRTFGTSKPAGMLFANPIPEAFAFQRAEIDAAINQAVQEAAEQGFHRHTNTPFILSRIKDLTHGHSLPANRALIESNVAMAAKVAVELSKFKGVGPEQAHKSPAKLQQEYLDKIQDGLEFDRRQLIKMRDVLELDRKLLEKTRATMATLGTIGPLETNTVRTSGEVNTRPSRPASSAALSEGQSLEAADAQKANKAIVSSAFPGRPHCKDP